MASSQQLVHASAGSAPAPTGPEPLHDNEYLGEGLDQLEGANPQVPSLPSPSYHRRRGAGAGGGIMARLTLFQRRSPKEARGVAAARASNSGGAAARCAPRGPGATWRAADASAPDGRPVQRPRYARAAADAGHRDGTRPLPVQARR